MSSSNPLRAITQRLNSTPVEQLPRYAGFLAASILNSGKYLQTAQSQKGDSSTVVHKLKTRILSLIQDKTQEGRYTGIVLAKAFIDAGGLETLSSSANWARSLVSCLNKRDLHQIKSLCVITIARIFLLTRDHPSLVREITSPILPAFISSTLGLLRPVATNDGTTETFVLNPLLVPVLQSWLQLIPLFATTFRPSIASIRSIMLRVLSEDTVPEVAYSLAAKVLAVLHYSAPKNSSSAEWMQTCQQIIEAIHQASDLVLRSVIEEWTPIDARQASSSNKQVLNVLATAEVDAIGMEPWSGMYAGGSRITRLLKLLGIVLSTGCAQPVSIPLASILDVTARLTAVSIPNAVYSIRPNQDISKDEREELWTHLPYFHEASLELLHTQIETCGRILRPVSTAILSQVRDVFEANPNISRVRNTVYKTIGILLEQGMVDFASSDSPFLIALVQACCKDLPPSNTPQSSHDETNGNAQSSKNTIPTSGKHDKSMETSEITIRADASVTHAAEGLFPLLFSHGAHMLPSSIRAQLDGAAILTGHKTAILASVLNPAPSRKGSKPNPSILPFLARIDGQSLGFEALVRPRMPVIQTSSSNENHIQPNSVEASDIDRTEDRVDEYSDNQSTHENQENSEKEISMAPDEFTTLPNKKREFEMVEQATTEDLHSEAVKRSRTDVGSEGLTEEASHRPVILSALERSIDISLAKPTDDVSNSLVSDESVTNVVAAVQVPTQTLSEPSARAGLPVGEADDSDDDEIPTIDATLSSEDEEEENEEDVEMREE